MNASPRPRRHRSLPSHPFAAPHGRTGEGRRVRRAATAVEFAMVCPIVLTLFFAGVEFCRVAMMRHTVDNAVYEGCRVGIIPGATSDEVRRETAAVLSTVGITGAAIEVRPAAIDRETAEVSVAVTVPLDANTFVPQSFFAGREIERRLTLQREVAQ